MKTKGNAMPKKQTEWTRAYNEKAYDRIALSVKKGRREQIRAHAAGNGESINGYINRLIEQDMQFTDDRGTGESV